MSTTETGQRECLQQKKRLLPKKGEYRQRAHCNPLSDSYLVYPPTPDHVDWSVHFPRWFNKEDTGSLYLNTEEHPVKYPTRTDAFVNGRSGPYVKMLDVGCGYGGLSLALADKYPSTLILGMEIREKVTTYVGQKIRALRIQHHDENKYSNVSVIRTNVMKFCVNYFRKAQLEKIFFCFPDPHFKKSNERRRIISPALLTLYAYVMKTAGRIYTITDVKDLHLWMRKALLSHPLFEEVPITTESRLEDPCIELIETSTEEGNKARRLSKTMYSNIFCRVADPVKCDGVL